MVGGFHRWLVCPSSSQGLSAISPRLLHSGWLPAHLPLSSASLPVIIEADTVPRGGHFTFPSSHPPTPTSFPSRIPADLPVKLINSLNSPFPRQVRRRQDLDDYCEFQSNSTVAENLEGKISLSFALTDSMRIDAVRYNTTARKWIFRG